MLKKLIAVIVIIVVGCVGWFVYERTCHYTMDGTVVTEWYDGSVTIEDNDYNIWEVDNTISCDTKVKIYFYNNKTPKDRTDDIIEKIEIK